MNRMRRVIWAMALGLLAVGPAGAAPASGREQACQAVIAEDLGRARRNPELAHFSEGSGWHRASIMPHLQAPLMAASFARYCQQGGRMRYRQFVLTFVRTNGFLVFTRSPDEAAAHLASSEPHAGRSTPLPHAVVMTEGMPRPHAFVSPAGLRLDLPDLHEGVVHIDARELLAVVRLSGRTMVLWQGQWVELFPDGSRPAAGDRAP